MNLLAFYLPIYNRCLLAAGLFTVVLSPAFAQPNRPSGGPDKSLIDEAKGRWATLGFQTRMAKVNGVTLHLAEAGKGEAVVLLHGYPQSGEIWRFIAPELAKNYHIIVVDLRGMGLSEVAKDGYNLANVAEDIHQLVRSLGVAKVNIIGHDWGGAVAAVYAMRYREEVSRLAFLESALAGAGFEMLWDFSKPNPGFAFIPFLLLGESDTDEDTTAALLRGREAIFLHHLWDGFTGDKKAAPFSNWKPYITAMARPGLAVSSASYYRSVYRSADEVKALVARKLDIPVLAIAGEKGIGANHEKFVQAFASNIKGNLILPGAGHFLAEERPNEVASALKSFLAE